MPDQAVSDARVGNFIPGSASVGTFFERMATRRNMCAEG
jgi:hypothetical protein